MTKKFKMYIDGKWVDSLTGETFKVVSPIDGEIIAEIPVAAKEDVDRAVQAAAVNKESFKLTGDNYRSDLCNKIADEIEKRKEEIAHWMTMEQGKPYELESLPEVEESILNFRIAAEDIKRIDGNVIFSNDPNKKFFTKREPNGVYAAITPWNFPMVIPVEYVAPGLVTGNTMVMKPASLTPITVLLMAECIEAAGVPKGVFNVVTGPGSTVGEAMVGHPMVDAVGFTGEGVTGRKIASIALLKRMLLEMGGNGPQIVLDDADIVEAAKEAAFGCYMNAGQVCCATERILVQKNVKDQFIDELLRITKEIKVGSPFESGITMGPLNSEETAKKVDTHIKDAIKKGAKIICGGGREKGFPTNLYYQPTILDNVVPGMLIHDEETFGPVAPITSFETDEEAVQIANSTVYGLQMALFTSSLKRSKYFSDRLQTGNIAINASTCYWEAHQPFGGSPGTESGQGRLGGMYTIYDMTHIKTVSVDFEKCK